MLFTCCSGSRRVPTSWLELTPWWSWPTLGAPRGPRRQPPWPSKVQFHGWHLRPECTETLRSARYFKNTILIYFSLKLAGTMWNVRNYCALVLLFMFIYMCRFLPTPASGAQARPFRNAPIRTFQSNRLSQVIFGASDVWSLSNLAQFGSPRWGSQNSQIWGWPQQMLHGDTSIISWQRYMAPLESWHELAHLLTSTYHWMKIMTTHIWKKVWRCLKHFTSFHIKHINEFVTTEDLEDWHVGRTASNPCFWAPKSVGLSIQCW